MLPEFFGGMKMSIVVIGLEKFDLPEVRVVWHPPHRESFEEWCRHWERETGQERHAFGSHVCVQEEDTLPSLRAISGSYI